MKLYVGNLPKQVTDAELLALASEFGAPTSSKVARERNGDSRGFGFLEFATPENATAALAGLHGREVAGSALKVSQAHNQTQVDPLGGRY